jgi:hypothetical protein
VSLAEPWYRVAVASAEANSCISMGTDCTPVGDWNVLAYVPLSIDEYITRTLSVRYFIFILHIILAMD